MIKLPPEEYTVESIFSRTLEQYVSVILMDEETTHKYLEEWPLERMDVRGYVEIIVMMHLEDPSVVSHVHPELYMQFLQEMYRNLIVMNPCLQLGHIIKSKPVKKKRVQTTKDDSPEKVYGIISDYLKENVIGQREAIDEIVRAVGKGLLRKTSTAQRPIVSMLFAGISGTGKSYTAKQLAKALAFAGLVNDKDALIQINAGEYGESHQLARLTGAPLGYVGSDQGTLFQNKIKSDFVQVILIDEIEKAHRKLYNYLLAILEDGVATSGKNEEVNMSNTIIILTSNLGSAEIASSLKGGMGFKKEIKYDKEQVTKHVEKQLPIEFYNRLNSIVIFDELSDDEAKQVAKLELISLKDRVNHLVELNWNTDVESELIKNLPRETGLRPIRTKVDAVEGDLSNLILTQQIPRKCSVQLSVENDIVVIRKENEGADSSDI